MSAGHQSLARKGKQVRIAETRTSTDSIAWRRSRTRRLAAGQRRSRQGRRGARRWAARWVQRAAGLAAGVNPASASAAAIWWWKRLWTQWRSPRRWT